MLHNDSLIYHLRHMTLATLRISFNALNKIIVYRRGLSPVCVRVTLLRAVLNQPRHSLSLSLSLSHTNTGYSADIFPPVPSTFIAASSAGLVQGSLPWLLQFLNSPFIPSFYRLLLPYFPAEYLHVYHSESFVVFWYSYPSSS